MPDIRIDELPAASTPLAGVEVLPIVQGGVTSKTTVDDVVVAARTGLTSSDVGLGNVDNTSDANKPVSTVQAAALEPTIAGGTTDQFWRGDKSWTDFALTVGQATLTGLGFTDTGVTTRPIADKWQEIKSVADYDTFANYLAADLTNAFFVQNGARVFRQGNRSFFGGAVANDGAYPNVEKDWLTVFEQGTGLPEGLLTSSQAGVLIDGSGQTSAWLTGSQSKDAGSADASCLGSSSIVVNNHATLGTGAWAFYGEAHRTTAAASWTCGMELDTRTLFSAVTARPAAMGNVNALALGSGAGVGGVKFMGTISGTTLTVTGSSAYPGGSIGVGKLLYMVGVTDGTTITALGTGTGGDGTYTISGSFTVSTPRYGVVSNQYDASAAIQISGNYQKFKTGINFQNVSITGADGEAGGAGIAIALSSGHILQWYNNSGQNCGYVYGANADSTKTTGIVFDTNGFAVNGPGSLRSFFVAAVTSAANYLSLSPAIAGNIPYIAAVGTDTNIDLQITPKGTGNVRFGTWTSSGDVAVNGYVSIKDAAGNVRKLATIA